MTGRHAAGDPRCRDLFARLSDYLDGDLDSGVCAEIDGHLEDCPPCQAFLESLRRTVALLDRLPGERLPDDIRHEVRAALQRLRGGHAP
ncbi:MAG TPA: zf-HC2 domain-containing protein [Candidatus Polarisedimenticolia bacterium]|nr:zf-HC2 domain-containing protein [Candidatus Polarisedimenticolia bacterium]